MTLSREVAWILLHCCRYTPIRKPFMSITIVSALPKSAPPQAVSAMENAASEGGFADSVQDFASLLLGQLAAARPGAGWFQGTAANDSGKAATEGEEAEAGDAAANLLAVLTQAPLEQREPLVPSPVVEEEASPMPAGWSGRNPAMDDQPLADAKARASTQALVDARTQTPAQAPSGEGLPGAASEPAAKFAELAGISGENAPAAQNAPAAPPIAANVMASLHARPDEAARPLPIATPLYDRAWSDDFAQKVTWVATHNRQSAELTLNPPAMGSIEISLRIDSDKSAATATFVSANADVRETIETALPRLREMLAGVGIALGQAQVSSESFRQGSGDGQDRGEGASPAHDELSILAPDQEAQAGASIASAGRGLVDMFV
jgi:flagellar hook-length control protein FliK